MPDDSSEEIYYEVDDGEWVGSIAIQYGFADWDGSVWQHEKNKELRDKRKDPHVLAPGDILYIPALTVKTVSRPTEQRHKFKLKVPTEVIRIRLLGEDGEPLKSEEYILDVDFAPGAGTYTQANRLSDGNGIVEEKIPSTAVAARLRIPRLMHNIQIGLGRLYPLDLNDQPTLILGTQQRLTWLGYDPGPIDGEDGPRTQMAVMAFQQFCKDNKDSGDSRIIDSGDVDGIVGQKTRDALLKYYGC